jgi:putative membrane protein
MLEHVIVFFKGFAMGLANVVPGVSGGTIALLAGIFERFINALKSFDIQAIKLLSEFKFKEFAKHTDLLFLVVLFSGEALSILTAAKLLEQLFKINNGIYVWAFFFGLIIASVYYIGRTIKKYNILTYVLLAVGTLLAYGASIISPASENSDPVYLIFCGAIAVCDMLLPGISGSYTLILLGNYKLVVIDSISHFDLIVLLPFGAGALVGFLAFARFLSWLMKNYGQQTTAVLTGFVFGSLGFLWPWKHPVIQLDENGLENMDMHGNPIVEGYVKYMPEISSDTFIAVALIIIGIAVLVAVEEFSARKLQSKNS